MKAPHPQESGGFTRCVAVFALVASLLAGWPTGAKARPRALKGYITNLPPESASESAARHQRVAERRAGTIVIVHRGAAAFAPENTLEAYAAAMDYGADGCEVDLRRTTDGVLVMFHDDMLDHLTEGLGAVNEVTCYELLALKRRFVYGTATRETLIPTFAALLALARQRAMLLHLDVKEPGLEEGIIRLLDAADAWDHVVAVNNYNADSLLRHPKLRLLHYKAGLFDGRRDMDPPAVRAALAQPGEMVIVDDARVVARELRRRPYQQVALPKNVRVNVWPGPAPALPTNQPLNLAAFARSLAERIPPRQPDSLQKLLAPIEAGFAERNQPDGDADYQRLRAERILERAWAAEQLARTGSRLARVDDALERLVMERSLHHDWKLHGLDGALASRSIGLRHSTKSAPILIAAFRRIDVALQKVANPEWAQNPLAWTDFRAKMYLLPALGELRSDASKRFLHEYVALDDAEARQLAPPMFEEATQALLRQDLTPDELKALLQSTNTAVRGTTILECLDHPTRVRTAALRSVTPWTLALPHAKR
jgi:glycerophosphoryl diester phosphodiesterase